MGTLGYFTDPDISGSKITFVCENDLWLYDLQTDVPAVRLTSSEGGIRNPVFNANGTKIAYSSSEFGSYEVYVIDLLTSDITRLTFLGELSLVRYWHTTTDQIIFSTNYAIPTSGYHLYGVNASGGEPQPLPYGLALTIDYENEKSLVLGRYQDDNARWKNYKGGTTGQIWYSPDGVKFDKIELSRGNHVAPMLIDGRIFFLSDFEGFGNLYSVKNDGTDLQQHTFVSDYYLRKPRHDNGRIILQKGGSLFLYHIEEENLEEIDIPYLSSREDTKKKFVSAEKFIEEVAINRNDTHALLVCRGKPFYFPFWEEGTYQLGKPQGVRYKLPTFHPEKDLVYLVSDELGEDRIEIFDLNEPLKDPEYIGETIGVPYSLKINSAGTHLALFNNHMEILLIDLQTKSVKTIYTPEFSRLTSIDWSPDGRWLTYSKAINHEGSQIAVYDIEEDTEYNITSGDFGDYQPRFGRKGNFLYFLSNRTFHPMMDTQNFQYIFPKSTKIYAIALQKGLHSPIMAEPKPITKAAKEKPAKDDEDNQNDEKKNPLVQIDLEGISERIVEFPLDEERIFKLEATEGRLLYATAPIKGMDPQNVGNNSKPQNTLKALDLETLETSIVVNGISTFHLSNSGKTMVVIYDKKVRLLPPDHDAKKDKKNNAKGNNRKSKYLDLNRIKLEIHPQEEWRQMVKETWKLMKEHYWEPNIAGINWERMLEKYLQILPKIGTRAELSDLLWELQGETRTSHSYEFGGDYKFPPNYKPAYLGVDMTYNGKGFEIKHIYQGDIWDETGSPLAKPGIDVKVGDAILAVDGQPVSQNRTVHELLMGKAQQNVYLKVKRGEDAQTVCVKTLASESQVRYRDWVHNNREYVHENTGGKVGYIHIPNMGLRGVQEFYRYYKLESQYDGLIIDVRFNGGGHTSQIFLEKIARKRIAYSVPRYGKPHPYPRYSVPGPLVCLTNEHAGSDGDIFTHAFKMLDLGPVVGTRTWGGVIGIWPKISLVDGSVVTQPEYSFWFEDVEWEVENYGTDPDIELEITPTHYMEEEDPQLDKSIEIALELLEKKPVKRPDFSQKPIKS